MQDEGKQEIVTDFKDLPYRVIVYVVSINFLVNSDCIYRTYFMVKDHHALSISIKRDYNPIKINKDVYNDDNVIHEIFMIKNDLYDVKVHN